jgi:hypothetical protein
VNSVKSKVPETLRGNPRSPRNDTALNYSCQREGNISRRLKPYRFNQEMGEGRVPYILPRDKAERLLFLLFLAQPLESYWSEKFQAGLEDQRPGIILWPSFWDPSALRYI